MYPSCVCTHVVFVNHARFNTRKQHAIWVRLIFLEDWRVGRRCCGGCLERTRRRCLVVFFPFLAVPSSHFVRNPWCPLRFYVPTLVDARARESHQISEPAVRSLIKGYLDMRNMVGRGTKTISATPRQLESLIRLSEGLAKMRHAR